MVRKLINLFWLLVIFVPTKINAYTAGNPTDARQYDCSVLGEGGNGGGILEKANYSNSIKGKAGGKDDNAGDGWDKWWSYKRRVVGGGKGDEPFSHYLNSWGSLEPTEICSFWTKDIREADLDQKIPQLYMATKGQTFRKPADWDYGLLQRLNYLTTLIYDYAGPKITGDSTSSSVSPSKPNTGLEERSYPVYQIFVALHAWYASRLMLEKDIDYWRGKKGAYLASIDTWLKDDLKNSFWNRIYSFRQFSSFNIPFPVDIKSSEQRDRLINLQNLKVYPEPFQPFATVDLAGKKNLSSMSLGAWNSKRLVFSVAEESSLSVDKARGSSAVTTPKTKFTALCTKLFSCNNAGVISELYSDQEFVDHERFLGPSVDPDAKCNFLPDPAMQAYDRSRLPFAGPDGHLFVIGTTGGVFNAGVQDTSLCKTDVTNKNNLLKMRSCATDVAVGAKNLAVVVIDREFEDSATTKPTNVSVLKQKIYLCPLSLVDQTAVKNGVKLEGKYTLTDDGKQTYSGTAGVVIVDLASTIDFRYSYIVAIDFDAQDNLWVLCQSYSDESSSLYMYNPTSKAFESKTGLLPTVMKNNAPVAKKITQFSVGSNLVVRDADDLLYYSKDLATPCTTMKMYDQTGAIVDLKVTNFSVDNQGYLAVYMGTGKIFILKLADMNVAQSTVNYDVEFAPGSFVKLCFDPNGSKFYLGLNKNQTTDLKLTRLEKEAGLTGVFEFVKNTMQSVGLKSWNGKFVQVRNESLFADASSMLSEATFALLPQDGRNACLRNYNGQFLTWNSSGFAWTSDIKLASKFILEKDPEAGYWNTLKSTLASLQVPTDVKLAEVFLIMLRNFVYGNNAWSTDTDVVTQRAKDIYSKVIMPRIGTQENLAIKPNSLEMLNDVLKTLEQSLTDVQEDMQEWHGRFAQDILNQTTTMTKPDPFTQASVVIADSALINYANRIKTERLSSLLSITDQINSLRDLLLNKSITAIDAEKRLTTFTNITTLAAFKDDERASLLSFFEDVSIINKLKLLDAARFSDEKILTWKNAINSLKKVDTRASITNNLNVARNLVNKGLSFTTADADSVAACLSALCDRKDYLTFNDLDQLNSLIANINATANLRSYIVPKVTSSVIVQANSLVKVDVPAYSQLASFQQQVQSFDADKTLNLLQDIVSFANGFPVIDANKDLLPKRLDLANRLVDDVLMPLQTKKGMIWSNEEVATVNKIIAWFQQQNKDLLVSTFKDKLDNLISALRKIPQFSSSAFSDFVYSFNSNFAKAVDSRFSDASIQALLADLEAIYSCRLDVLRLNDDKTGYTYDKLKEFLNFVDSSVKNIIPLMNSTLTSVTLKCTFSQLFFLISSIFTNAEIINRVLAFDVSRKISSPDFELFKTLWQILIWRVSTLNVLQVKLLNTVRDSIVGNVQNVIASDDLKVLAKLSNPKSVQPAATVFDETFKSFVTQCRDLLRKKIDASTQVWVMGRGQHQNLFNFVTMASVNESNKQYWENYVDICDYIDWLAEYITYSPDFSVKENFNILRPLIYVCRNSIYGTLNQLNSNDILWFKYNRALNKLKEIGAKIDVDFEKLSI